MSPLDSGFHTFFFHPGIFLNRRVHTKTRGKRTCSLVAWNCDPRYQGFELVGKLVTEKRELRTAFQQIAESCFGRFVFFVE